MTQAHRISAGALALQGELSSVTTGQSFIKEDRDEIKQYNVNSVILSFLIISYSLILCLYIARHEASLILQNQKHLQLGGK